MFQKALDLVLSIDDRSILTVYEALKNLADVLVQQKDIDKALYYTQKMLNLFNDKKNNLPPIKLFTARGFNACCLTMHNDKKR